MEIVKSRISKQKIQCACLGTIIKVPIDTVTLIEDFGMMVMDIFLLFLI